MYIYMYMYIYKYTLYMLCNSVKSSAACITYYALHHIIDM